MSSRRQVGVHDFQSPLGICSNGRQDSRSQLCNADSVRPIPDFMQPSLYWVCSSFLIFNYLYLSDWRLEANVGKQLSQAKLFRLPAPWVSWRQEKSLDLSFLFEDLTLRNLMKESQNHQEAPNPWPSILLSCQCPCSHRYKGERWSFQSTVCGDLSY